MKVCVYYSTFLGYSLEFNLQSRFIIILGRFHQRRWKRFIWGIWRVFIIFNLLFIVWNWNEIIPFRHSRDREKGLLPLHYPIDFSPTTSTNPNRSHCLLQETLPRIQTWSKLSGFCFSSKKTRMIILSGREQSPLTFPSLLIYGDLIPLLPEIQFLGVYFDNRPSWILHIRNLKSSTKKTTKT